MCGIFALLCNHTTDGNIFARVEPSFMKGKKRGPESTNFFIDPNTKVCLGFHRLAINGLDSESDQPLVRDNCRVICSITIRVISVIAYISNIVGLTRCTSRCLSNITN